MKTLSNSTNGRRQALSRLLLGGVALAAIRSGIATAKPSPVFIGFDGEFGLKTGTSAQAIEQGILIALDEINAAGGVLGGRPLQLITRDNQSIVARGVDNLKELAAIPDMVAVIGGRFSPVIIESVPHANRLGMPLIVAWASAEQIINPGEKGSHIFRVSLSDAWAGEALLRRAAGPGGNARRVGVLLPNTAWGRSNDRAIRKAAKLLGTQIVGYHWHNWGDASLKEQYAALLLDGAESLLFVSNESEAVALVREMAALPASSRIPVVAHWGLSGGRFVEIAGEAVQRVDMQVIQSFSFLQTRRPKALSLAEKYLKRNHLQHTSQIAAPVGVAQAYDATHLIAMAVNLARSTDRRRVRDALEHLGPWSGAVRDYAPAFSPSRHEALGPEQVLFARFAPDGTLMPVR